MQSVSITAANGVADPVPTIVNSVSAASVSGSSRSKVGFPVLKKRVGNKTSECKKAMTDTIADFLTRVRNALKAGHKHVDIPASNLKKSLAHILYEESYINGYQVIENGPQGTLRVFLKYNEGSPVITGLERISKPGLRIFKGANEIPRTLNGLGLTIVTTPKGVMTDARARAENVGGEVLCRVW